MSWLAPEQIARLIFNFFHFYKLSLLRVGLAFRSREWWTSFGFELVKKDDVGRKLEYDETCRVQFNVRTFSVYVEYVFICYSPHFNNKITQVLASISKHV